MPPANPQPLFITHGDIRVSALLHSPPRPRACYMLALAAWIDDVIGG
jgi:hypothetical protein